MRDDDNNERPNDSGSESSSDEVILNNFQNESFDNEMQQKENRKQNLQKNKYKICKERPRLMSASSDDSMSSPSIDGILGNYHSDDSDSSKSESTDNEEKANKVLEKPIPK